MNIGIIGANGFIGSHLSETILSKTDWNVFAIDLRKNNIASCLAESRFHFHQGDLLIEKEKVTELIRQCDVILPLAAIALPSVYVTHPLKIFELDFEANVHIVRECAHYQKRLVFPSTSEVYGMCSDAEFDEEESVCVTGPIHKERWIYSTAKQLLDRVIYAYGKEHQLNYTLFRPFNWYGPRLDDVSNPKPGGSRVLTQFIGNILRGESISLVDGGKQQRCFTYIDDGIDALLKILKNEKDQANQKIFNIGNPREPISIRGLAERLIASMPIFKPLFHPSQVTLKDVDAFAYYGAGYQDVFARVPSIRRAENDLKWRPTVSLDEGLKKTLAFYVSLYR